MESDVEMRSIVLTTMEQIMRDNDKVVPRLDDNVVLLETDFDSLCFALLVSRLEDQFGVDPFSAMETADLPVTVGDLVTLYERAAHPAIA